MLASGIQSIPDVPENAEKIKKIMADFELEMEANFAKVFAEADADKSGALDAAECAKLGKELVAFGQELAIKKLDGGKDMVAKMNAMGMPSEVIDHMKGVFKATEDTIANCDRDGQMSGRLMAELDTNHDGKITKDEFGQQFMNSIKHMSRDVEALMVRALGSAGAGMMAGM